MLTPSISSHLSSHTRQQRRRRVIGLLIILAFLLPWLFVAKMPAAQQWRDEGNSVGFLPVPVGAAVPLPTTAPRILQYWPIPVGAVQNWIEQDSPGALAGEPAYANIIQAAMTAGKRDNLNPLLLLGILNAEQSFLSPNVPGGLAHAQLFTENPWDYGVYPGSPFAFDIGPTQSAEGAATLVDEMALAVLRQGWSWSTFESALAQRYAQNWQPWVRITFSTWSAMEQNPSIAQGILIKTLEDPAAVPALQSLGSSALAHVAQIAIPGGLLLGKILTILPKIEQAITGAGQGGGAAIDSLLEDVGVGADVAGDVGAVATAAIDAGLEATAVAAAA